MVIICIVAEPPRPLVHFTPERGWLNDPHAVVHEGGRYHLFFQNAPGSLTWQPEIAWGHATSVDLITWHEEPVALAPLADETGCWTGTVAMTADGPVILYTSVLGQGHELGMGRVAVARGDASLEHWARAADRFVIAEPPEVDGDTVTAFRDPYVWPHGDGWVMVIGAGLERRGGAVLQYRSGDLVNWKFDGVVADASSIGAVISQPAHPVHRGTTWECPLLFPLDGSWVLLVSVWDGGVLFYVAAAVGSYDGSRFVARSWERFTHGDLLYAATTFVDEGGRRCALAWLREGLGDAGVGRVTSGALSLPYVLRLEGDRLFATVHPAVASLGGDWPGSAAAAGPHVRRTGTASCSPGGSVEITLVPRAPDEEDRVVITLTEREVVVRPLGADLLATAPLAPGQEREVAVVLDGDILELSISGMAGLLATRVPVQAGRSVEVVFGDRP